MTTRRTFRSIPRTAGLVCGGALLGICVPSKDMLPPSLLSVRVTLEGLVRISRCAMVASSVLSDYRWSVNDSNSQEEWNTVHTRCAARLYSLAEENGGLYVKAGQIFANMNHVLPQQYCTTMARLQDKVASRPFEEVEAVLRQDFGSQWIHDQFEYIDPTPIASASLAQVHRGRRRTLPTQKGSEVSSSATTSSAMDQQQLSKDVAIKVQYIDVALRFTGDMLAINTMLSVAGWLYPGYDLSLVVDKLRDTVAAELDFRLEAKNMCRAAADLKRFGFGDEVVCATLHPDLLSRRVLTTNFCSGVKINDAEGMKARGISPRWAAKAFISAMAMGVYQSGFFHADPHAGNVLVHQRPGAAAGVGQVVLLDYGLCGELSTPEREELSAIWVASTTRNDEKLKAIAKHYGQEDHDLLASCFLQHPYRFHSMGWKGRITGPEVRQKMRETMVEKMNEVNTLVAALPKQYALVMRAFVATKAVNRDLGDATNRALIFLRYALANVGEAESIARWQQWLIYVKAYALDVYASMALKVIRRLHPELADLGSTYQMSG